MELKIKDCTERYWLEILNIRNSDKIFFIDQDDISESSHIEYMKKNEISIINDVKSSEISDLTNSPMRL